MISLGQYIIESHTFSMKPDSLYRHMVASALVPYWIANERSRFIDGKKINKIVVDKKVINTVLYVRSK